MDIHPIIAKLLELDAEEKAFPEFVERLEAIAKNQGWHEQFTECKKEALFGWEDARAVSIRSGQVQYVVVLLKSWTHTVPGSDVQTVILLDDQGRLLDRLGCEINSRLSRMFSGRFHTAFPGEADSDGAQIVIRLDGQSVRGNFAHHINHNGAFAAFYWGHSYLAQDQPTKWDTRGLCRIAIRGGKFNVLFPDEQDMEQRP